MDSAEKMVQHIKLNYDLDSPRVFSAMLKVPRQDFIPPSHHHLAFQDCAVPIGFGQTISQPYTVAFMTHLLDLKGAEKVLEIGTGSGYQAAVLSHLAKSVYSIERLKSLAKKSKQTLEELKINSVHIKSGRGELGWPRHAPFDRIIVTANLSENIPPALFDQLKENGLLVAPVRGKMIRLSSHGSFRFVPFVEV